MKDEKKHYKIACLHLNIHEMEICGANEIEAGTKGNDWDRQLDGHTERQTDRQIYVQKKLMVRNALDT